ncbi:hypothetical protein WOSG25_070370 [Weissella oryzae SG25]|uniref:Uncharacterized protein n=1 Tax=Weissella oryzae (strain DSM 25784 / JCM 18191 / LMG 30913 / SG25) TaxID=1329250 RepID=A0A069CTC1_WEIOS|nr:hypothetical protein [Weissella oryzae]GAK31060.1 hypothetical protein WOSG25_070370 [Weissella oryzae SG25]
MTKQEKQSLKTKILESQRIKPYRPSQIRQDAQRDYLRLKQRIDQGENPSTLTKDFGKKIGITLLWIFVAILAMVLISFVL